VNAAKPAAPDRRQALVTTAATLFAERSYDKVTTTEIAKAAGVAYGLIAHHFGNKRGLYLAVMQQIADELAANQSRPPLGDSVREQLRHALTDHIDYIDQHAAGFTAIMRGGLGADPDIRAMVNELRWNGAQRVLHRLGVPDPVPPAIRTTMRGWVAYLDEIMLDRLEHRDLDTETLVELAATALITALHTAVHLTPPARLPATTIDMIDDAHRSNTLS
jgi:AcrR family transcriptional regulator